jgi:hypothetical protein
MKACFEWTRQKMDLVRELLDTLSDLLHEWSKFISPDGDWVFFSDLVDFPTNMSHAQHLDRAGQSLRSIKQTFGELESDRNKLVSIKESLSRDFSTVR